MDWVTPSINSIMAPKPYMALTSAEVTPTPTATRGPGTPSDCLGLSQETIDAWEAQGIQYICVPASAEVE